MAQDGFGTSPYILPNMFSPPGQALENTIDRQERERLRRYEIDYRNQRNNEADNWRKIKLIQDLTDIDKYQTGEAAADAIGNQKAAEILQKYSAMASGMSLMELQGNISRDMQKTVLGMGGLQDELSQSDKAINSLKQLYPSINTAKLRQEHRKEILSRRINNDADFENPLDVKPSAFKLDNPDFLSFFVDDPKKLFTESIRNPKLVEKGVTVAMGSPNSYTSMEGNLPFFRKLNYDAQKDVDKGFLRKGINPSMDIIKEETNFSGKQTEVLGREPFSVFDETNPLELRSLARQKYNDYDLMNDAEKETARREVALDYVNAIDKSGFSFKSATKPPSTRVNVFNIGGSDPTGGGKKTGNELDRIGFDTPLKGMTNENGVLTYNGENTFTAVIPQNAIPASLSAILKAGGTDISDADWFTLEVDDGVPQSITPTGGKKITRTFIEKMSQKKYDAERKGEGMEFGVEKGKNQKDNPKPKAKQKIDW